MDSSTSTSTIIPAADEAVPAPEKSSVRCASRSSSSSRRSRSSSSSRSSRRRIVVSEKRRLVILALRYVISQKEYAFVRRRVLAKAPPSIASNTPTRAEFDAVVKAATWDDFLPASSRAGLRMLLLCNVLLNSFQYIVGRLRSRKLNTPPPPLRLLFLNKPNFLSACSLSTLIVFHRLLYRFFYQLRSNLQLPEAKEFRQKYPKASQLFLSPRAPPLTASLAGFALLLHPATDRRVTISVYTFVKALEFIYNRYEDEGWFQNRPWWLGSWLLFPLTSGQLLYSFLFERYAFPEEYCNFITKYSPEYIQPRPVDLSPHLPWPDTFEVLDSLPKIASLRFPPFSSPILFPHGKPLPTTLTSISPIVSPAHPAIKSLQCALLHPSEPSCLKTYIHFWASELPRISRFLAAIYCVAWIPRYKKALSDPTLALKKITSATALTSLFITGALGSAWAACCLLQSFLPAIILPKLRFWLAGFLAGLWAAVDRHNGRANFLYSARIGLVSAWKVLHHKGWVAPLRNGDVLLFVAALMAVNSVYDTDPAAISGGVARRVLASLRGRGFRDYVAEKMEREKRVAPLTEEEVPVERKVL
ncbi:hypothetical protein FN846DRAFT_966534 [Sphaerosporella brunnea]|uniref:Transmembrane protein 135 N-terminal domain-containing protein n=1 Tax=Sphaerosporella brunnea TaxID=1250544 RepID=A0A5J5EK81_9PEZI|nr:hypothetical protein FN846DRAFT_966534 [Sphaerosporella brunnea]